MTEGKLSIRETQLNEDERVGRKLWKSYIWD